MSKPAPTGYLPRIVRMPERPYLWMNELEPLVPVHEVKEMLPAQEVYGELRPMVQMRRTWWLTEVMECLLWLAPTIAIAYCYWEMLR